MAVALLERSTRFLLDRGRWYTNNGELARRQRNLANDRAFTATCFDVAAGLAYYLNGALGG